MADYLLALAVLAAAFAASVVVIRGPLGLAFKSLRDNPAYAQARGIGKFRTQLWVFGLSALFTGLAGAVYAAHFKVVGPTIFSFTLLLFLLSMIVVGGMGSIWGPLIGAALLMLSDEALKELQGLARARHGAGAAGLRGAAAGRRDRASATAAAGKAGRPLPTAVVMKPAAGRHRCRRSRR